VLAGMPVDLTCARERSKSQPCDSSLESVSHKGPERAFLGGSLFLRGPDDRSKRYGRRREHGEVTWCEGEVWNRGRAIERDTRHKIPRRCDNAAPVKTVLVEDGGLELAEGVLTRGNDLVAGVEPLDVREDAVDVAAEGLDD